MKIFSHRFPLLLPSLPRSAPQHSAAEIQSALRVKEVKALVEKLLAKKITKQEFDKSTMALLQSMMMEVTRKLAECSIERFKTDGAPKGVKA